MSATDAPAPAGLADGGAVRDAATVAPPKNVHGFMAFGISSTALIVGTAAIGIVSIMASLGLPGSLYRVAVVAAHAAPLLLGAWGIYHGITAFVLAKRGIPCHKESEFAAFLGIVIGLAVIGMFLWFGVLSGPGVAGPRP